MVNRAGNIALITALSLITLYTSQCPQKGKESNSGQINNTATAVATAPTTPTYRTLYHGVHPGSATGDETIVEELGDYEGAVGKEAAFVYFTQELNEAWLNGSEEKGQPAFPGSKVDYIRDRGAIPVIRLMIRKSDAQNEDRNLEDIYSYNVLLDGPELTAEQQSTREKFRRRILEWGRAAAGRKRPIYVEWGTEVNGKWFWWNAKWYAEEQCAQVRGDREKEACLTQMYQRGTEKFQQVFRHLRQLINVEAGASNVRWIFHVTAGGEPDPSADGGKNLWNGMANYYPGRDYVDAIGLSVYGAQRGKDKCDGDEYSFAEQMDQVLLGKDREEGDSLKDVAAGKKIFVLEFGETLIVGKSEKKRSNCNAGKWAADALQAMFDPGRWEKFNLVGFSWWNEAWVDEEDGVTDMRVQEFDICRGNDEKTVAKTLPCDCWRGATRGCKNLRKNRTYLRQSMADFFKSRNSFLRTSAGEDFPERSP